MNPRHFHVTARELLLDQAEPCPFYPPLTFDGLALTPDRQHHLILTTPAARLYAGPDTTRVARRAAILAAALRDGNPHIDATLAEAVRAWVETCWESTLDELVAAFAGDMLEQL